MNSATANGMSSGRCSQTKRAAFPVLTTGAFSTASFGSCAQVHPGVICPRATVPIRLATIALFAGAGLVIMDALAGAHDAAVLDTSVVRVHQHGSCIAGNKAQHMGRSRGGLTSKIHAGSGRSPFAKALGQTYRRNAIAKIRSASPFPLSSA